MISCNDFFYPENCQQQLLRGFRIDQHNHNRRRAFKNDFARTNLSGLLLFSSGLFLF